MGAGRGLAVLIVTSVASTFIFISIGGKQLDLIWWEDRGYTEDSGTTLNPDVPGAGNASSLAAWP